MARMRMAAHERARVKVACLRLLAGLWLNPAQVRLVSGFIDTYLPLDEQERVTLEAEINTLSGSEQEGVMEIVTSWQLQGREEGREEERRELVQRMLASGLAREQVQDIVGLTSEELERLLAAPS